jgi:hypothetical protein
MDLHDREVIIKRYSDNMLFNGEMAGCAFEFVAGVYSLDQLPELIRNHIERQHSQRHGIKQRGD